MSEELRPIEDLSFREAMAELESIVSQLEGNTLELEESLKLYERGVSLLTALQQRLEGAEQKVTQLMGELSGEKEDEERDSTLS